MLMFVVSFSTCDTVEGSSYIVSTLPAGNEPCSVCVNQSF